MALITKEMIQDRGMMTVLAVDAMYFHAAKQAFKRAE